MMRMRGFAMAVRILAGVATVDTKRSPPGYGLWRAAAPPLIRADRGGAVADDLPLYQVDDILGDVRGVVGDPLQVPRRREQRQALLHHLRRLLHHADQLVDD